ncbi:glycosyltransferase family 39 protein [Streptococcus massiliensis]|uniref:Integral membrane protein n=1 Tax=Streptococcus massiliensis TaxID=313439 RepID=A0A380KVA8_9STRE|nr:glycosyltransferase family 39 protein [Streptococcus massiliensis]SUN75842.1 integral membrane protein [Streptococcus massiliensis]
MNKLYQFAFSVLQKVMLILALHWVFSAFWQLSNIVSFIGSLLLVLLICLLFWKFPAFFKKSYEWLMRHKLGLMFAVVIFQVAVLLSAELLIRRDAAVVFTGAFGYLKESSISSYLTRNPNNIPLFLYERFFFKLFGATGLWVMQGLNIFYADITAGILYWGTRKYFNQQVANKVFSFYILLLGFSPFFMAMYTDIMILPLVSSQLFLALALLKEEKTLDLSKAVLLGLVTALAMIFRPTVLIVLIALFVILFFIKSWKRCLLTMAIVGLAFTIPYGVARYAVKHQTEIPLVEGKGLAKGPLLFINLGLTDTGTDQEDMKDGLLQYIDPEQRKIYNNGMFATENVIKEIKRRLSEYTPWTFFLHSEYKQRWNVMDGTLDWIYYENAKAEKTPYISPLYPMIEGNPVTDFIRSHFISYDDSNYVPFAAVKQLVWILMSVGLVFALWKFRPEDKELNFLSLAVFGGLLFLTIFEGGKTRYLIQFLPQILLLSSLGLTYYPIKWQGSKRKNS